MTGQLAEHRCIHRRIAMLGFRIQLLESVP